MKAKLSNMLDRTQLLDTISGKRRGVFPFLINGLLSCLTPFYRVAVAWRNRKFDNAIKSSNATVIKRVPVPVVSVGNLTTGGTGKSPMVIWIAKWLRSREIRVAIVSRGYGSDGGRNDEAREMEDRLPDVPQLQDPDRHAMAMIAINELESQLVVLDDGFQHRKLARDLDVVLIDATCPFGFGRVLPRGLLREPIHSLQRADFVMLTRTNVVNDDRLAVILETISPYVSLDRIGQTTTVARNWLQHSGATRSLDSLESTPVLMTCGIGNPDGFSKSLKQLGMNLVGEKIFADHHRYSRSDIGELEAIAKATQAQAIVCTHKDLVKLGVDAIGGLPVYALLIDIEFVEGRDRFEALLQSVIPENQVTD